MEKKVKNSQLILKNNLEAVIESSYDGIFITDGNANALYVNKSYERIAGITKEEVLGKNMLDLEKSNIISKSATLIALRDKKITTLSQTFKTGKSVIVTSTPIFDENKNIILVVTNVRDISELEDLKLQLEGLKSKIVGGCEIIAKHKSMTKLLENAKRIASVDTTVLILGETGVGKEGIAKYIYANSHRANKPYIKVNCGAIPENLLETEFFGYEKGAFTGAKNEGKAGLFELANDGTIFLDEIGELPLNMQVKLLRVLQEETITKIGGSKEIKINVRIIAATNKDLEKLVEEGQFRDDLYYRLNVIPILVPPLRERKDDILLLTKHFECYYNKKYNSNKKIDNTVIDILHNYNWPGNVRELKNTIERMILLNDDNIISLKDLPANILKQKEIEVINRFESSTLKDAVSLLEYEMITKAYEKHKNVRDAAEALGIDSSTFVRKRQKYADANLQHCCKNATYDKMLKI
ncbi:MAG TPA: transcriptional regulator [Clostridiales bacterium]|nr:transcriptional regulator [Clostridiales bacterium]